MYIPIDEREPEEKSDYLCRLLTNCGEPFYWVMRWHGTGFWKGQSGPFTNVTHWRDMPVLEGDKIGADQLKQSVVE